MTEEAFRHRARALEDRFFANQDSQLLEKLRTRHFEEVTVAQLGEATGISDQALLSRLAQLQISVESLAALSVIPLVEIAWADGAVADDEREAVLKAASAAGVSPTGPGYRQLETWLTTKPDTELLAVWKDYVAALAKQLGDQEYRQIRDDVLARAKQVASAAGGYLGFGSISPSEQKALDQLAAAFSK